MHLTLQIPDIYFVSYQKEDIAKQIKLYTALMMFRSEQVSAGSACEIAGIDRYTFIEKCKEYDIPVINYSINEIEDELQQYQKISK
jgi:predicted HTH domain antitoxin